MPRFNPLDFDYELISDNEIDHYQKKIKEKSPIVIYELGYFKKENIWIIFIESTNLNQYLPEEKRISETFKITIYAGKIKSNYDFRFLMNKIVKKPEVIIQLGC